RLEPEPLAGDSLDLRVDRRVLAHGARELPHAHPGQRPLEPRPVAVEPEGPTRELQTERRGLGVRAARPAHAQRLAMLLRAADARPERAIEPLECERTRLLHGERERSVEHVRRREPEVEPAPVTAE